MGPQRWACGNPLCETEPARTRVLVEERNSAAETRWAAEPFPGSVPEPHRGPCLISRSPETQHQAGICTWGVMQWEVLSQRDRRAHPVQSLHLCGDDPGPEKVERAWGSEWLWSSDLPALVSFRSVHFTCFKYDAPM